MRPLNNMAIRAPTLRLAARLTAFLCIASAAAPALAQSEDAEQKEKLKQVEMSIASDRARADSLSRQSEVLRREIASLRNEMIAVAGKAQGLESELSDIEGTIAELEAQETSKLAELAVNHGQLADTLGALQRIAISPPETLLASPGLPIDTARSAMLLSLAVPRVEARVDSLRDELEGLRTLRSQIKQEEQALAAASDALLQERSRLEALVDRKRNLREEAAIEEQAARERAERLAAEAEDLRDLLARLEHERAEREALDQEAREQAARRRAERERAKQEAITRAARARELKHDLEQAKLALEQAKQEEEKARQEAEATRLASEAEAARQAAQAAKEAAAEAEQLASLDSSQETVDLEKPDNVRAFPDSPVASLTMPARGEVIARYGQANGSDGGSSKGITIATRTSAQIVAPFDGRIVYAGPFRGYGQILIIEHGGRYHTLLAGLERIDAIVGQWVLAGEPLGVMGGTSGSKPELYLELRRTGAPINPLPWLATTNDKVQG